VRMFSGFQGSLLSSSMTFVALFFVGPDYHGIRWLALALAATFLVLAVLAGLGKLQQSWTALDSVSTLLSLLALGLILFSKGRSWSWLGFLIVVFVYSVLVLFLMIVRGGNVKGGAEGKR